MTEKLQKVGDGLYEKPKLTNTEDLIEITEHLDLRAYLSHDEVMGKHLVVYLGRGDESNGVGVNVHPLVSKKILDQFDDTGNIVK